jgi:hypothetical protein
VKKMITDIKSRAIKTFVQAFLGTLIPEVCAILAKVLEFDWGKWYVYVIPIVCGALSAGISAAWNTIQNSLQDK